MKISVIVPVYNSEKYLHNCINSIINQTYKELEIILVNDGSVDSSSEICRQFSEKDNRIVVINQKNSGVSVARNNGLKVATGDYVGFVDSDDFINENMYETLISLFEKNKADFVGCKYRFTYNNKKAKATSTNNIVNVENNDILNFLLDEKFYGINIWNKLFKTSVIKENNLYFNSEIKYAEDLVWLISYINNSNKAVFCDSNLYMYNQNNDSAMACNVNMDKLSMIKAHEIAMELLSENKIAKEKIFRCLVGYIVNFSTASVRSGNVSPNVLKALKCYAKKHYFNCLSDKSIAFSEKLHITIIALSVNLYKLLYGTIAKLTAK